MTGQEIADPIGRTGYYHPDGSLEIPVVVRNTRPRYGTIDYLIAPIGGSGEKWVADNKVKLNEERI